MGGGRRYFPPQPCVPPVVRQGLITGGACFTTGVFKCLTCNTISLCTPTITHHPHPTLSSPQLCAEDYHWWWRAYFTSGASALYLLAYSAFYFYSKLTITKTIPMLMYFGYMSIVSYGFFCLTGQRWGQGACMWARTPYSCTLAT